MHLCSHLILNVVNVVECVMCIMCVMSGVVLLCIGVMKCEHTHPRLSLLYVCAVCRVSFIIVSIIAYLCGIFVNVLSAWCE